MAHIVDTPDVTKQGAFLPRMAALAAIFAGVINIIGTAALLRGWLIDIGMRYYDGMSIKFNLPRGVFLPSEGRLLQTGYSRVAATLGEATAVVIISLLSLFSICSILYLTNLFLGGSSKQREITFSYKYIPDHFSGFTYKIVVIFISVTAILSIIAGAKLAHVLFYQAPKCAYQFGEFVSDGYLRDLQTPGCPKCQLFGNKNIRGIAVFADNKSLLIGTIGPGLTRVPLDNIIISPQRTSNISEKASSIKPNSDFKCVLNRDAASESPQ
ncbi:hypothetical protein GCM10022268_23980 [Sphingomonas cynarae]|uniref:Uncharacterized protein n=1 Tax=Sphingomonas cynarae TaxID=930197 RepID=A0ABP7E5K6_9SPHN